MRRSTNNTMRRGVVAVLFSCLLSASMSMVAAADGLSVSTEQASSSQVNVEVRNTTDSKFVGTVSVRVVVAGIPVSVPVTVDLSPGETVRFTVDVSRLRGPVSIVDEGTPF